MTTLREAAQQALEAMRCAVPTGKITLADWLKAESDLRAALAEQRLTDAQQGMERSIESLKAALAQQPELDHETRAELAEQQVVQLAEERDHYRNLWQKAQQAEPVPTHRINSWGFCGVCRHDRIPGEGCARQECPDSPQQAEPVEQTCTWQQDGDSDSGVYGTSCGRYFNIEDGTPEDNKMAWCCYCGKKLAQELITENKDD